jgi:hypothetical protein
MWQPSSFSVEKSTKNLFNNGPNVYPQYGADGTMGLNPWARQVNNRKTNQEPISLQKMYGGPLGTYQPSIIRPLDNVRIPQDVKRGSVEEICRGPVYTGSKFQEWCSEDNAINYYAMRPIVNPDEYSKWLRRLFDTVVMRSMGFYNIDITRPQIKEEVWESVFCDSSKSDIMNHLMLKITEAVEVLPEMHKNGSWKVEQFHWTDAQVYQLLYNGNLFYKVLFNLYNPLRSISTQVEATLFLKEVEQSIVIIYMGFVSSLENEHNENSIKPFNLPLAGQNYQINMETEVEGPKPTDINWNYGNTLLQQNFNQYGYYDADNNVPINAGVPESLKPRIKQFEDKSKEFLLPAGTVKLNADGVPKTVSAIYDPIYRISNDAKGVSLDSYVSYMSR